MSETQPIALVNWCTPGQLHWIIETNEKITEVSAVVVVAAVEANIIKATNK